MAAFVVSVPASGSHARCLPESARAETPRALRVVHRKPASPLGTSFVADRPLAARREFFGGDADAVAGWVITDAVASSSSAAGVGAPCIQANMRKGRNSALHLIWSEIRKIFFPQTFNSRDDVKRRLKMVIAHDRTDMSPEAMDDMRREILSVVSKYVDLEQEEVEFALEADDRVTALIANFPIKSIKTNSSARGEGSPGASSGSPSPSASVSPSKSTPESSSDSA
eukprot:tig00001333_g8196.t1